MNNVIEIFPEKKHEEIPFHLSFGGCSWMYVMISKMKKDKSHKIFYSFIIHEGNEWAVDTITKDVFSVNDIADLIKREKLELWKTADHTLFERLAGVDTEGEPGNFFWFVCKERIKFKEIK